MSAGTKIFLACGVLIVGTLVVYYTMIMGGDTQPLDVDNPDNAVTTAALEKEEAARPEQPKTTTPPGSNRQPPASRGSASPDRVTMGEPGRSSTRTPTPRPTNDMPTRPGSGGNQGNAAAANGTVAGSPERRVPTPSRSRASDGGKDLPDDEVGPGAREATRGAAPATGSPRPGGPTPPAPRNNGTSRPRNAGSGATPGTGTPSSPTPRSGSPSRGQPTPVTTPSYQDYFVQPGDTLSSIASDWFGDESKWELIASANPGIQPDRIRPGDLLRLPPKTTPRRRTAQPARPVPTGNVYTVKSGDTLSEISKAVWGRASLWQHIYEANRDIIGDDHHALKIGMVLRIPAKPAAG